ncbi:MAG: dephospho-CoA kinase [Acidobacteriota bacterium]
MLHVGLTGGIGSGKSTVAAMLEEMGAVILDADRFARELIEPGGKAVGDILGAFGTEVGDGAGGVDREALAAIVFKDRQARRKLESILHPKILARRREVLEDIRRRHGERTIVVTEAALILEAGTAGEFDALVLVKAPEPVRKQRLAGKWSDQEISRRMKAQWRDERKVFLVDYVVDNGGTQEETRRQVDGVWRSLLARLRVLGRKEEGGGRPGNGGSAL